MKDIDIFKAARIESPEFPELDFQLYSFHKMASITLKQTQATAVTALLEDINLVGEAFSQKKAGAREQLMANARRLISVLETSVEAITWMAWAEVDTWI